MFDSRLFSVIILIVLADTLEKSSELLNLLTWFHVHSFDDDVVLKVNDLPSFVASWMLFLSPDGLLN